MHPLLKYVIYVPLVINSLIALFYFVMTFLTILFPSVSAYKVHNGLIFLTGCCAILGLLGWSYSLAIAQHKLLAGFGMLAVSYMA